MRLFAAFLLAVAAPMAAAPAAAQTAASQTAARPNQGLKTAPLAVVTAKGRHAYTVEVAATPEQQEIGLMYRRDMPRNRGMVFPMSPARPAAFWMRNTWLPLDIIFIAPGGRVLNVGTGMPLSETLVESAGPVEAVLELNAGEAARIGLKPGDRVMWKRPVDGRGRRG